MILYKIACIPLTPINLAYNECNYQQGRQISGVKTAAVGADPSNGFSGVSDQYSNLGNE